MVGFLLLQLLDGNHNVVNVLLDGNNFLLKDLLVLHSILTSGLSLGESVLSLNQVLLKSSNVSSSLGLLVVVDRQVTLLLLQLGHQSLLLILDGFILLQESGLGLELFIILAPDRVGLLLQNSEFLLRVGHSNEWTSLLDDDKPSPFSHGHVLSEVSLSNLDQFSLVSLLFIDGISGPLENFSLDESDPFNDQVITSLLKTGKSTSSEEDKSVSKPVSLPVKANLVHEGVRCNLVVRGGGNLCLSKTSVSHLEVRVKHSVGETSHTDSDSLQHTITSELVHDKMRLNLSWLLVSVGHKTTDKVRLARVKGGHQLSKRDQVDRGDSLAPTSLLLLLTLILLDLSGLSRMVGPEEDQELTGAGRLEDLNNSDIVGHNTSVMRDGKVSILVSIGLGLQENWQLA